MDIQSKQPVIRGVRFFLAHTPGLVRHGSKPSRDIHRDPGLLLALTSHLCTYKEAVAYPPNRAFLGDLYPDSLLDLPRPWFHANGEASRWGPHGEIMPEDEFYGLLKICDSFDLVWLEEDFTKSVRDSVANHPLVYEDDLERLGSGQPYSSIESKVINSAEALPLYVSDGRIVGCVISAHEEDASLAASVLLENLACKATATMALRTLLAKEGFDATAIEYVLNSGEEAVGERYQRGGGSLAKAVAEMCHCIRATGSDIKAFCCGPVHSLMMAAAMVNSGLFHQVAVVGGCFLAKLGMKFRGHVDNDYPILEDLLAGVAVVLSHNDGYPSPRFRLDSIGRHTVGAGSSQQAIFEGLGSEPLQRVGMRFQDCRLSAIMGHRMG